jgi:hypothetical protein
LTQSIFNRDLLLANRSQNDVRQQASQSITNNKIAVAANVAKHFMQYFRPNNKSVLQKATLFV